MSSTPSVPRSSTRRRRILAAVLAAGMAAVGFMAVDASSASAATGTIVGTASGRCVDVPGSNTTNGTQLALWDCNGGSNQSFTVTSSGQLQVLGKCLDASGFGRSAGTKAILWTCTGGANQKWRTAGNGTITGVDSGLCLDASGAATANATPLTLWTCTGGGNQSWKSNAGSTGTVPPTGATPTRTTPTGTTPTGTTPTRTSPTGTPPTRTSPTGTPPATSPATPPTSGTPAGSPSGTPVALHGQLHVCGTRMCDKNNAQVQLRGISSFWLNWDNAGYGDNLSALKWMRDNWHLQVFRAAMGVEPSGAYLSNPTAARAKVETIINNAVAAGVYVIVDFHADNANQEQSQAVAFFADIAKRYGNVPNVIYEPWNEPHAVSWTGVLKPYHQAVINAIRASDPDNIVVMGTPNWSQDVDAAAASPLQGTNLMYTLHFYSCSHGASLRAKGDTAIRAGLALFITEWGATNADGGLDGQLCTAEAQTWLNWAKTNGLSWAAWKLATGSDSSALLTNGAPVNGGWNNYLHGEASFVVANM